MGKALLMGLLMITLGLTACGNVDNSCTIPNIVEQEEGSFDHMEMTYNKYKITFYTPTSGHPSGEVDFSTGYMIEDESGSVYVNIDYIVFSDTKVEDAYPEYESFTEVQIGEKDYKYISDGNKTILLYKIADNIYVEVDVFVIKQFDADGRSVDATDTPATLIESGKLDEVIKMDIEILK